MISIKIHKSYRYVVAICDSDLVGKQFEQDKFQLDIKENFFKEEEVNKEKAVEIMKNYAQEDATFNIIGEESTQAALKAGIITKEGIKKINNIPFALVLM